MAVSQDQAVILAGGQATRMRPYTDDRPKAMVEVAGRPIIEHQIEWLRRFGVTSLVVSCGYRADLLQSHLGDGSSFEVAISYAIEETPLGRGGGLKYAAGHLAYPGSPWFALNGDVIARFDLREMSRQHESNEAIATIALAPYTTTWGIAELDGDRIKGFAQSPRLPYWINAGIYRFQPALRELLPDIGDHEDSTFPTLASQGRLYAFFIDGYWRGIDTAKDISEATKEIEKGR